MINRQLFYVHTFFVAFTIFLMGCLCLFGAPTLLASSPLGVWVAGGLLAFWLARLYCQYFVYDKSLWVGQRFNTFVHIIFGLLWAWYSITYGLLFLSQIGMGTISSS